MPDAPHAAGARQHAPATLRNRDPILAVLREELPANGTVLEVASGTGEHAAYFAAAFPKLRWQPSDADDSALASIAGWRREASLANLLSPRRLDVRVDAWPQGEFCAIVCCNMVHIAPWEAAEALLAGAGRVLAAGSPLVLYGPFLEAGTVTAPSNVAFDESLRARDPRWGLRDVADLDALASRAGLVRTRRVAMPANNLTLVWRRG